MSENFGTKGKLCHYFSTENPLVGRIYKNDMDICQNTILKYYCYFGEKSVYCI